MDKNRNFNEFENRAGSRIKTLFRRVEKVYRGDNATARMGIGYLNTLVGSGLVRDQGRRLAWILQPLRMIPIRQGDEILVMNTLGQSTQRAAAMLKHFEASWGVSYPDNLALAAS